MSMRYEALSDWEKRQFERIESAATAKEALEHPSRFRVARFSTAGQGREGEIPLTLDLSRTTVSDVTAPAALTGLKELELSNTPVKDVTAPAALSELEVYGFCEAQPRKQPQN